MDVRAAGADEIAGMANPFVGDPDREAIWSMLVARDIEAFVDCDWSRVADDFLADRFLGIHGNRSSSPDDWTCAFPTREAYRDEWLRQARETASVDYAEPLMPAIHRATDLSRIDITGEVALAYKKFDGVIRRRDGTTDILNWQTLYFCRFAAGRWKITGFVGYLPYR